MLPESVPRFHDPSESAVLRIGKSKLRFVWVATETALSGELMGDAKFKSSKSTRIEIQSVENEAIKIQKGVQRKEREFIRKGLVEGGGRTVYDRW